MNPRRAVTDRARAAVGHARWVHRYGGRFTVVLRLTRGPQAWAMTAIRITRLAVLHRQGRSSRRSSPLRLQLSGQPRTVWVADLSDVEVLREIFVRREYDLRLPSSPTTVVDLGSHIGLSTLWWTSRFPGARVVCVEPDPSTYRRLERNLAGVPRTSLWNAAVGARPGELRFRSHAESWRSTVDPEGNVTVRSVTIDEILEREGLERIDLLKMDVEGAEFEVFASPRWLARVDALMLELHDDLESPACRAVLERLDEFDVVVHEQRPGQVVLSATRPATS